MNTGRSLGVIILFLCTACVQGLPVQLSVEEPSGAARRAAIVTSGVPFPQGRLKTNAHLRLVDDKGGPVPLQYAMTGSWPDGSVKWALLDFQTDIQPHQNRTFHLSESDPSAHAASNGLRIIKESAGVTLETGLMTVRFVPEPRIVESVIVAGRSLPITGLQQEIAFASSNLHATVLSPDELLAEEAGPVRGVVRVAGWITDGGTNRLFRYQFRIHAYAGASQLNIHYTLTQLSSIKMLWVKDWSLIFSGKLPPDTTFDIAGQDLPHTGRLDQSAQLAQLEEGPYQLGQGTNIVRGLKSAGWVRLDARSNSIVCVPRYFWQEFPKALTVSSEGIRFGLYPSSVAKPFDFDQGLAKTHEFLLDFAPGTNSPADIALGVQAPLFGVAPKEWYCDSKVFGDLLPFNFDLFPDYETLTEASGDSYIKRMATGIRNWGDVYYGGEYKGTNSYMNLEYDVHHNMYCQFARTGLRKYLDAGVLMAKHQADIDTNHKTGWQWKHSPRHVEIQAEFGHTFTRGLIETYYLTGNKRCLEVAKELGDYFIKQIQNPRELGNERQIGWGLISLLPVYEATWDRRYFDAAKKTVDRLLEGLDERGKFAIRWDNRISFFNGIAATGFIYYYRATGDERVAEAALRVIRRAMGFYPEYAGRTLEAIAWASERTGEPEFLDFLARTWETTMARQISWTVMELGAPTIFTVHALPFMARSGFVKQPEALLNLEPSQFATENGLYAHHLPAGDSDLYLNIQSAEPVNIVVIRKGAWKSGGEAVLFDPGAQVVDRRKFPKEVAVWQREFFQLQPKVLGPYRLQLRSPTKKTFRGGSYVTWDVATSRPIQSVFQTKDHAGLEFVTPYLFTIPRGDTDKIEIDLVGEGEGFKKGVIYDPAGRVAGSVEAFIDLGDKGRYQYKLKAHIPPEAMNGIWKVSFQDVSAAKISGLSPYFSTSEKAFFAPHRR